MIEPLTIGIGAVSLVALDAGQAWFRRRRARRPPEPEPPRDAAGLTRGIILDSGATVLFDDPPAVPIKRSWFSSAAETHGLQAAIAAARQQVEIVK